MISVVIPLLNESRLVLRLMEEVFTHLKKIGEPFEVICVDDGSTDSTLDILLGYRENNKELKVISLSRNFGLQAALTAGLEYASGDYIVMMDGDFQDPPELLSALYRRLLESNADIVTAVRERRHEKVPKRIYIKAFHRIFSHISESRQISGTGNFSILNRKAHSSLLRFTERNRYLPGIRNFIGFKQEFIVYARPDRLEGEAKMSPRKLFSLAADAIYSFSKWPVRACLYAGLAGIFVFLGAIVYTLVSKAMGFAPLGWSSVFLIVSFFGSVQLTFLGIIGEYIYRIFKEVQNRPVYLIRDIYG